MKSLRNIKIHQHAGAWGAQIADDEQKDGAVSPLRPAADDETLSWAASFWPEAPADAFEWDQGGRKVRDKATGEILKIRFDHPRGGELESDVVCVRDDRIILLGKPGGERPRTTHLGFYYGRKVEYAGPPSEGAVW